VKSRGKLSVKFHIGDPGALVHTYTSSYWEAKIRRIVGQSQSRLKLARLHLNKQVGIWFTPLIPAAYEM
jgi:hypothetical protein